MLQDLPVDIRENLNGAENLRLGGEIFFFLRLTNALRTFP